jgi:predicted deacetylase
VRVHVSIHDVAPPFREEVELALAMTRARGAKPALLVVPDYHGASPLGDDPGFCAFLRDLQKSGHEIFLHGFSHRADVCREPGPGDLRQWFAQRVVSDGEAEMSGLSPEAAAKRLDAGESAMRDAGLRIDGFVPPAWSLPHGLIPILAARRYAYTEDHLRIYAPAEGRSRVSIVLNYASRSPARLYSSVAFCRAATPLASLFPSRIAIHPSDMRSPTLRQEVARLLGWGASHFVKRAPELFG